MCWRTPEGLGAKWGIACGQQGNPWSPLETVNTGVRFGIDHRDGSAPPWGIHGQNFSKGEVITPAFLNAPCPERVGVSDAVPCGSGDNRYRFDKDIPSSLPVTLEQKDALCWEALLEDSGSLVGCSHPTLAREGGAP